MMASRALCGSFALMCVAALAFGSAALAQPATGYTPKVGQEGKDVVWVPTPQTLVDRMLDMAKATPQDYVIDLGSGDGRTVITAAKRGIKAHGIEYNPEMVELAKGNAKTEGVADKATFFPGDGADPVPAHRPQHQAPSDHPEDEARHARGVEYLHDGRLGAGRSR
jgi:SAM-dependent methyltransferase